MFKKLKRKIIISIMTSLLLVFIVIIGVIYTTTYKALYANNQNILEQFTEKYIKDNGFKIAKSKQQIDKPQLTGSTVFYGVSFCSDESVYQTLNDIDPIIDDEALIELSRNIIKENKDKGYTKEFIYRVIKKDGLTYVTFMKNTLKSDSVDAILENTIIFGIIVLIVIFAFSFKIADKITRPLEENYNKQKQFISDAGHEFKTPIATINANSEILERQIGKNQWIENIKFENKRMHILVNQLLNLARTEKITLNMEHVNYSRIIEGGVLPFESVAFEKGYELETNIQKNLYVIGEVGQLSQLISILIDNAISHAEGKGVISILLKDQKNMTVLTVSNPGKEMSKEDRKKIFERFYRIDSSRSLDGNGHYGLGLSIAKAIVNAHKGEIIVRCKDGITSFIVNIPQK